MDVLLAFDDTLLAADAVLAGADLASDNGLGSAVIISLFTDRRARPDDRLAIGEADRRGWWGDILADIEGDEIGSRIWLLGREKMTPELLVRVEEYAAEALAWLTEDGIARAVEVSAAFIPAPGETDTGPRRHLELTVNIHRPDAGSVEHRFSHLWEAM